MGFGYNRAGQITSLSRSNDAYAWTGAVTVNRAYTTNGLNQYTAAGPAAFTYDANGNLTSDGSTNFTYDVENRLVAASGSRTAALRYDPLGRLYEVTGPSGWTRFLYDGDALVEEYIATGIAHVYVHGSNAGADDPLIWYTSGTIRWLHSDHQGSITGTADPQGNLASINSYDEYGIPGASNAGRFQYTGQVWLPEVGLAYYRARFYSPTLGRFLQTDPIGHRGGMNLYAYVGNDPVNFTDPTGLQCDGCQIVVTATRLGSSGVLIGGGAEGKFFLDTFVEGLMEGVGGAQPQPPQQPPREHPACRTLRENAEAGRDSSPFYAGANWDRLGDMIYFMELYRQNAEELGAFGNSGLMWAIGLAANAAGGTIVGGALGGAMVWGNEMRSQSQRRYEAARARVQYLHNCGGG